MSEVLSLFVLHNDLHAAVKGEVTMDVDGVRNGRTVILDDHPLGGDTAIHEIVLNHQRAVVREARVMRLRTFFRGVTADYDLVRYRLQLFGDLLKEPLGVLGEQVAIKSEVDPVEAVNLTLYLFDLRQLALEGVNTTCPDGIQTSNHLQGCVRSEDGCCARFVDAMPMHTNLHASLPWMECSVVVQSLGVKDSVVRLHLDVLERRIVPAYIFARHFACGRLLIQQRIVTIYS